MSLASSGCTSLCPSPPAFPTLLTKQGPSSLKKHSQAKNHLFLSASLTFSDPLFHSSNHSNNNFFAAKASETEAKTAAGKKTQEEEEEEAPPADDDEEYEEYEVVLDQPFGLRFTKGRDGGTYIDAIAPGASADRTGLFSVGDKVLATSAVFGDEIWPAAEYGRTMYTIRQRIGPLLMKMQKRYGKVPDMGDLTEKEIIKAERNSGVISNRVREIQLANAMKKKEQKERREKDLREGLLLYRSGKYEEALEKFEAVLGSRPEYNEAAVASYNVACCYSKLNQVQAGLSALEDSLEAGFEDFKRIRTDPDLANLRTSEEFESLLKRFDESFINENALNAIKSIFGIFKKE
ncbi:protein MET1, chloroplastic isoform X1 [Coffea arabica]|uniref:Protein MET1, chloroplastic isoform X1 n=1 Tax=Coffea arabica TaxID=13443 RepID=A0A6P6XC49_COFAR|nr:protein MET1, chloroplastic-like isoform X1 [Coffea arabica]